MAIFEKYNKEIIQFLKSEFTEEIWRKCCYLIAQQRELIEENPTLYTTLIRTSISSSDQFEKLVGICHARYAWDNAVWTNLENVINGDLKSSPMESLIQIQAVYEYLEIVACVSDNFKMQCLRIIFSNLSLYKKMLDCIYSYLKTDDEKYNKIKSKLLSASKQKQWVYLIELSVCGLYRDEAIAIIHLYHARLKLSVFFPVAKAQI